MTSFLDERNLDRRLAKLPAFWLNPMRRYQRQRHVPNEPPLRVVIGQRPSGALERVRSARTTAGRLLLLAEHDNLHKADARHPSVVEWRWTGIHQATLYVATAWREPQEAETTPIPLLRLLRQLASAARGVAALHAAGLVHGDLKPETILRDGELGVVHDLKLARPPGPRPDATYSPKYAAPEQILEQHVGPPADVYALGVTLYDLFIRDRFPTLVRVSGRRAGPPGAGGQPLDAITSVGAFAPGGPPGARGDSSEDAIVGSKVMFRSALGSVMDGVQHADRMGPVLAVIRKACDMNPAKRYPDAAALADALEALCGD